MSDHPTPDSRFPTPDSRLPPSERDFEIYDAIHIDGSSTRNQAKQHEISQTRVRQIIRRVVEWLGEVLPPQTKVAKEQETRLARQIAADRFQRQFEQINELWKATLESKFASIRIRLTTSQARLGVVGGLIDGLAADAIEGIPVPVWTPAREGDPNREGEATAEPSADPDPDPKSKFEYPNPLFPPPQLLKKGLRNLWKHMPHQLTDPLYEHEITPEIVAARAAWGCPLPANWIKRLQDEGKLPRDDAPSLENSAAQSAICNRGTHVSESSAIPTPPPPGDFSPSDRNSSEVDPTDATQIVPTQANPTTCEHSAVSPCDNFDATIPGAQPLLTPPIQASPIELRISPDHPGAATTPPNPTRRVHEPAAGEMHQTQPNHTSAH